MGIRFPLKTVLDVQNNGLVGAASVNGGIAQAFNIPQDTDNIVVKFTASTAGAGVSTVLQTTDDGGTTWYDVARTSIVSDGALPEWLVGQVVGGGVSTAINGFPANSILSVGIGNAAASTVGQRQLTGLPLLSTRARVFHRIGAGVTGVASIRVQVMVNSEAQNN